MRNSDHRAERRVQTSRRILVTAVLLAVSAATANLASAATLDWIGASVFSNDWSDSANWSILAPPDLPPGFNIIGFPETAVQTTSDLDIDVTASSLVFKPFFVGGGKAFTIDSSNGSVLTITSTLRNDLASTQTFNNSVRFRSTSVQALAGNLVFNGNLSGLDTLFISANPGREIVFGGAGNRFLSSVSLNSGQLRVNTGNLDASGNVSINAGTTLRLDLNTSASFAGLSGSGEVQLFLGSNLAFDPTSSMTRNFSGTIVGSGSVTKTNFATQILSGNNTYSGSTRIENGTLQVDHHNALGISDVTLAEFGMLLLGAPVTISNDILVEATAVGTPSLGTTDFNPGPANSEFAGALTLQNDVALRAGSTDRTTFSGRITGTGDLIITSPFGSGRRIVIDRPGGAANDFTGDVAITSNAHLQLGVANAIGNRTLPDTATIRFTNAASALRLAPIGSGDSEIVGTLVSANPGAGLVDMFTGTAFTLGIGGDNEDGMFRGMITDSAGALTINKVGIGTQTFTGTNTYSGGTAVSAGTLVVNTNSLPAANGVINNATLEFNQATDGTYGGVISGVGQLIKSGVGTLTLGQPNTYSGSTRIDAGKLAVSANANLGADASTVVFSGGALQVNGSPGIDVTLPTARPYFITNGADAIFDITAPTGVTAVDGLVEGFGGLIKNGPGALMLRNTAAAYAGSTTVNQGTLITNAPERLPDTTDLTLQGGTKWITFGGAETIASLNGSGDVNFVIGADIHLVLGANDGGGVHDGSLSETGGGVGRLTKIGSGRQTLLGNNIYSGGTTVSNGTLAVNTNALPTANGVINDAVLEFLQTIDGTYAGVISGAGQVVKTGGGRLTLNQANSYAGGTSIAGGRLIVDTASLPATNGVDNDAILEFDQAVNGTYSGLISGSGQLVKTGNGTLTLQQTNTYLGDTRFEAGTLAISHHRNLGDNTSSLTFAGGALRVTGPAQVSLPGVKSIVTDGADAIFDAQLTGGFVLDIQSAISGDGGLVKNGPAALNLRNNVSSFSGPVTVNQGQFGLFGSVTEILAGANDVTVHSGGTLLLWQNMLQSIGALGGDGAVGLHNNGAHLRVGQNDAEATFDGNVNTTGTGAGATLTKIGAGNQTFTGTVGVSRINVDEGTLAISGAIATATAFTSRILGPGTLSVSGGTFNANGGIDNQGTLKLLGSNINTTAYTATGTLIHEDGTFTVDGGAFDITGHHTVGGVDPGDRPILKLVNGASGNVTGTLTVGSTHSGELQLQGASTMNTNFASFGDGAGGYGAALIDNAALNVTGFLITGRLANSNGADIAVMNGGSITAGAIQFANGSNPTAPLTKLTVVGPTSSINGDITVGAGSPGQLLLADSGIVNAPNVVQIASRGILAGNGQLNAPVVQISSSPLAEGTVDPGQPGQAGRLAIDGNYIHGAGSVLKIDVIGSAGAGAASGHDQLTVSGTAFLDGSLEVTLFDSGTGPFQPVLGDSFDILTAETISGSFVIDPRLFAALGAGLEWHIGYLADAIGSTDVLRLNVVAAVPVPGAVWLFGSGVLVMIPVTRRRFMLAALREAS